MIFVDDTINYGNRVFSGKMQIIISNNQYKKG